jgi:hypothetical protein
MFGFGGEVAGTSQRGCGHQEANRSIPHFSLDRMEHNKYTIHIARPNRETSETAF